MKENQEKHEIDRIAEGLGCEAEFYDGTASMYIPPFYVECKKQGWKDALLAKLRAIVCPDYEKLKQIKNIALRAENLELKSQISTARKEGFEAAREQILCSHVMKDSCGYPHSSHVWTFKYLTGRLSRTIHKTKGGGMKTCDRCNKEIYLGMTCQEKDCIYVETFCGLDPILTGEWDPFYQSGACTDHDNHMVKKDVSPFKTALEFVVDVSNTAVINTAKAAYSVAFALPYAFIGAGLGFIRDVYKRRK